MRLPVALTLVALATLSASLTVAADLAPDTVPAFTLTTPHPTRLAAATILYETIHAAPAQCADPVKAAVRDLYTRIQAAHIAPSAGPIIIFTNLGDPNTPTDIQIAVPVIDAPATLPAGLQRRELASVPSLTALFQGKFADLSQAYGTFMQQALALHKRPVGELRQRTLYYESETSENNVVMIEIQTAD